MNRTVSISLAVACVAAMFVPVARAADPPSNRVIAIYFHRTERCPTCLKMGDYAEEAVEKGFPKQVEKDVVGFYFVDYQKKKNAALTKGYKISKPSLVVVNVKDNKAQEYRNLKDIWSKVQDKSEFLKYVRANVAAYLK